MPSSGLVTISLDASQSLQVVAGLDLLATRYVQNYLEMRRFEQLHKAEDLEQAFQALKDSEALLDQFLSTPGIVVPPWREDMKRRRAELLKTAQQASTINKGDRNPYSS
jgi:hypothetical protein